MTDKIVFTAKEAADYLNVCYDTVTRMCRKKEMPHFRVGKKILIEKDCIDDWIRAGGSN